MISGCCREADENCALLSCYAASGGNFLPTFRHNLSVPFSGGALTTYRSHFQAPPLKMGPIGYAQTSVRDYHCSLRNDPEERTSQTSSRPAKWDLRRNNSTGKGDSPVTLVLPYQCHSIGYPFALSSFTSTLSIRTSGRCQRGLPTQVMLFLEVGDSPT